MKQCPKCNDMCKPKWHNDTNDKDKGDCEDGSVSKSRDEHLHYYCKCGYDFISDIGYSDG